MEKVIAVVVTYNRLTLLKECINALRGQSRKIQKILVVNNGSTDGTTEWLKTQPYITAITQKNSGSGGGFEAGLQWAYKNGFSWIWCMDDDGHPASNALENLLEPELPYLCLRNCAVINAADKQSFVWKTSGYRRLDEVKTNLIEGGAQPFNGTLIHRSIIERVGLPTPQFFMWGDEAEYYYRIVNKNKIPVYTVASSVHYHPPTGFSFRADWDYSKSWKMYYYIRNKYHVNQSRYNTKLQAALFYAMFLVAMMGVVTVFQKTEKFKKLSFIFWPAIDAVRHNFNASPATVLERLATKSPTRVRLTLSNYIESKLAGLLAAPAISRNPRMAG
jgi:rhamnopyranosyl-N-acetylglucosaminyl-diphospho-decaprenol beta-1,3/1,4-galactofuranosyltransferase